MISAAGYQDSTHRDLTFSSFIRHSFEVIHEHADPVSDSLLQPGKLEKGNGLFVGPRNGSLGFSEEMLDYSD